MMVGGSDDGTEWVCAPIAVQHDLPVVWPLDTDIQGGGGERAEKR